MADLFPYALQAPWPARCDADRLTCRSVMKPERRQFIRVRSHLMTFVKVLSTGKVQRALTKDIGGGGVCALTEVQFDPGTEVELEITLPDRSAPITGRASVVWSRSLAAPPALDSGESSVKSSMETGLRFLAIDPKEQALLTQYARLNAVPESP